MPEERAAVMRAARAGDPIALCRTLVAIPSENPALAPASAGEAAIAAVAAEILEAWGLGVEVVEVAKGRPNVVAHLEGEGPTLLLNGHLDTVAATHMSVPPFGAELRDGRVLGRGACDMKGGIAALMAAVRRLVRTDAPRPAVIVALTADEEHASLGMQALVASGVRADVAVVCEPTSLAVMPAHKGFVWLEVTFRGRAAHGSRPDLGVDAIRHAGLYLSALETLRDELRARPPHPLLGHGSWHAGTIRGGAAESIYPASCRLTLERRTLPGEAGEDVLREFRSVLDGVCAGRPDVEAELKITMERPGTEVSTDDALVQGLLAAARAGGVARGVAGMTAWVDASWLNLAGIPAVCFGPGSIARAHTDNESIDVEEIERCADILERFARSLVSTAGG